MTNTASLYERLQRRDDQALAELFSVHRPRMERMVALRLDPRLRGRVGPDDVLQESYLSAAERLEHFDYEHSGSFFVWLRMIVCQTLTNIHRRHFGVQMRDASRDVSIFRPGTCGAATSSFVLPLPGKIPSPSHAAMYEEAAEKIQTALGALSECDRDVLTLRHFEQLTNQEVAEVLGISEKAASMRYIRAIKRLKETLDNGSGSRDLPDYLVT